MAGNLFGKMAADTLGLSDIGKIISPKDFDKVDGDDYIMNEDGEKIYFVIKSKSDEYVFTNRGLLHVDGDSAVSKKRVVKRHDFYYEKVHSVTLETAYFAVFDLCFVALSWFEFCLPFQIHISGCEQSLIDV